MSVAALLVAAPASGQGLTVRDDRGREHRFDAPPQRIVTLLPSLTESVFALGAGERVVGIDRFSNWPAEVSRLPRLGGLEDAQTEAIARLKPDVVLASTSARALDRLDALGLRVLRLKSESHADVRRTLSLLATLLGTPQEGERLWVRLQQQLADAAAQVPPSLRGRRVYFEIGGGPYAAGTTSFIGETLAALGLVNIVPAELGPFPKLNPEFVVRGRPDIVMGVQREVRGFVDRPGWRALTALRDGQVCGFESPQYDVLTLPGPRLGEAAGLLAACLRSLPQPRR